MAFTFANGCVAVGGSVYRQRPEWPGYWHRIGEQGPDAAPDLCQVTVRLREQYIGGMVRQKEIV